MQLPGPFRAYVGLLATAADEAKRLPDRAIEFPMLAISTALQMSLRAQQRYARLTARGDEVLNRRHASDEPPSWATFDEPVRSGDADQVLTLAGEIGPGEAAGAILEQLFGSADEAIPAEDGRPAEAFSPAAAALEDTAALEADGTKTPAKRPAARSAPAKHSTPRRRTNPPRNTNAASDGKTVNAPRHTSPSPFDAVGDD